MVITVQCNARHWSVLDPQAHDATRYYGAPRLSMSLRRGPWSTTAVPASAARYGSRRSAIRWTHSTSEVDTTG